MQHLFFDSLFVTDDTWGYKFWLVSAQKKHNIAKQMPSTLIVNNVVVFNVLAWKCWRFHLPLEGLFVFGCFSGWPVEQEQIQKYITVVEINGTMHSGERMWLPLDFKS